ncbi:DEAD/DEAH box helicase [Microbacterium gorillae]|uniref:DEAD/DEAH box helicase n=1 Tax=Microbacterium gorillae TaxID=1231063 RepID=UPI00058BD778|nr:DEAD/DEAH box helicase [Microbacterium gorillae]
MPKQRQGGRAPKNYDPRYGDRAKAKKSGIGRTHRGYRDASETEAPAKRRWSAEDRAGRDQARGISQGQRDRSVRGDLRGDDARPARHDRFVDRPKRDDRPARDDRFSDRPRRDDRGGQRDDRGGFRRDDRGQNRDDRGGFRRDDRAPRRDDRGDFRRDDRGPREDRSFDRPRRDDRGDFRRDDRGPRQERTFDRPRRDDRGDFRRDDRGPRQERTFDRPRRDDRFSDRNRRVRDERSHASRSDWKGESKPAFQESEDVVLERLQAQSISADDTADTSFDELGLGQNIVRVLAELGAEKPFPIQAATIPVILDGRDTLGRGRTGSGKTIAFGAPLVERILRSKAGVKREFGRAPAALILAPTRELALQIDRTVQPIARSVGLFTTQIYGGVPQGRQVGALKKGVDIIIGTPGRIEDLVEQGKLDLSQVSIAVLDEADHMCELGFLEPVQRILRHTAADSQKLLFSATLDTEVEALVKEFLVTPAVYEVSGEDQDSGTIDHRVLVVDHREKADVLEELVSREGKTLVFTRTRAYAEMLAEQFEDAGVSAVALHGDLNQAKRTRNLQKMSSGRANVLVATDVAARGIHVDDIDLVIQADPPMEYKTYLHRAGRTGRAGRAGTVVTLVSRGRTRRVQELLARAEIDAPFDEARPGDEVLEELAGRSLTLDEITA